MALDDWADFRAYRPFTITIASPGVITSEQHGLETNDKVILTTTGALPTGLSVDTYYFVIKGSYSDGSEDPDTFKLASSKDGTAINTSSTQSGIHYWAPAVRQRMIPVNHDNR